MRNLCLLITALCLSVASYAQRSNRVGIDMGFYAVGVPKHHLSGDTYNPNIKGGSSCVGVFYERGIIQSRYGIKVGLYPSMQFGSILSVHVPVEFNGNLLGCRDTSLFYLGYTGGLSLNVMHSARSMIVALTDNLLDASVSIGRRVYVAPHMGLSAGFNWKRLAVATTGAFHFLIPEFAQFKTTFAENGVAVTQTNTNASIGISLKVGVAYRF